MMKKWLIMMAVGASASAAMASYTNFIGQGGDDPSIGGLSDTTAWSGGVIPFGSVTGVVESAVDVWSDVFQDMAVRLEGGTIRSAGDTALRGGSSGSGVTSILEIDTTDYATVTNLQVGSLTLWSQFDEDMELSILNGSVEVATNLNLVSGGHGTINMGNGSLHAPSWTGADAKFNMLAGGSGTIVVDDMATFPIESLNFETGNRGSITYGENAGNSAAGQWEWAISHEWVSVDGVVNTNALQYVVSQSGNAAMIALRNTNLDDYDLFTGMTGNPLDGVGGLQDPASYVSGTTPDGVSSTGLIMQANNIWEGYGFLEDFGVRLEGGTIAGLAELAMRGGTTNGVTGDVGVTFIEIDAADYQSTTNFTIGKLTMWSRFGGDMTLNVLRGTVGAEHFEMYSGGHGTVNLKDGVFHAGTWAFNNNPAESYVSDTTVNMLAGGSGNFVIDNMNGLSATNGLILNFESDNAGGFTLGQFTNDVSAAGQWEDMVAAGRVLIDGVPTASLLAYDIINDGNSSTISLPGPMSPMETYMVWASTFGLSDTNTTAAMTADPDGDFADNLAEYSMGGNPTNSSERGYVPVTATVEVESVNYFTYVHYERADKADVGLSYSKEQSASLEFPAWSTSGVFLLGSGASEYTGYNAITNFIGTTDAKHFMRLRVEFQD